MADGLNRPDAPESGAKFSKSVPADAVKSLRLITPYFSENRLTILLGLVCLVAVDILQLIIPRVIKAVVDDLTAISVDYSGLAAYALQILGIAVGIGALRYVWRRCLIGTSRVVEEALRNRLFSHLQSLSAAYFDRAKTGDLMAHATNDIQHVRMATGMGMVALTDGVVLGAAAVGFMAAINVKLTLFVLIPMPMIVLCTRLLSRRMHRLYRQTQETFSEMTEVVRERMAGIRIIKAYTGEERATEALRAVSASYISRNLNLVRITGFFFPMMMFFSNLSMVIVLFLGGLQTLDFTISPGDFVAFISYIGLLTWPMMAMGWVANLIQRGKASLDRIDRILSRAPDIVDRPGAAAVGHIEGKIRFEAVSFAYPGSGGAALQEIDFSVAPGETLGIVGPPGSGKSTLLSLIPRLYDPTQGRILLDDRDIRALRLKELREQIAFVPQEPFLFTGTLRENILAGRDASERQLRQAAHDAALLSTVETFTDGFDTLVGERGVMLSGGQKQRVALARALLRKAPVVILDDPISQMDTDTGAAVVRTLEQIARRRTVIIVSHRLAALRFAHRILVMESGRIEEYGPHETLAATGGFYARTFRLQQLEEEY